MNIVRWSRQPIGAAAPPAMDRSRWSLDFVRRLSVFERSSTRPGSGGVATLAMLVLTGFLTANAAAQSSSKYGDPADRRPLTLADVSWSYQPAVEPKPIEINDLITIVVDEKSQVISEGEIDRRKKASIDAALKDWVLLEWLALKPDPQSAGDPKISGSWNNKYRSEAELETRDAMKFKIACRVVDIRPNGNLVLEGRRTIRNNNEVWEQSLTGIVRAKDILPDNTVLSENIADLRLHKREAGHVRDGYRRGFLLRFLDTWQLF